MIRSLALLCVLFTGCSSVRDALPTAVLSGAGAIIGNIASDGDPAGSAIGAAILGGAGNHFTTKQQQSKADAYADGYAAGQANAIKQRYWAEKDQAQPLLEHRFYEIPVPGHRRSDGVLIAPHTRTIQIVE